MEEHHKEEHTEHSAQPEPMPAYKPVHHKPEPRAAPSSDRFWKITTVVLIVILGFFLLRGGNGGPVGEAGSANAPSPSPTGQAAAAAPRVDMEALADDDAAKGDPDAPVMMIEFSDFECPFCGRFYSQTLGLIQSEYIDTGKVRFVYRDFPLASIGHTQAQKAAEAAECAGEQGKFWEMHDLLFEQGVQGGVASFKEYASDIGLDTGEFNTCLDSNAMRDEVQKDFSDGQRAGVTGTPGFLINGQLVSGAQPFSVFQQVIEAELAG